jgi:thioredoxin-like negative regulator of GroEL
MITIDYIGAKWCSTCKTIGPQIEELCKKFAVTLNKFDLDTDDVTDADNITKVPTIRINDGGICVIEFNSKQTESVDNWLKSHITLTSSDDF